MSRALVLVAGNSAGVDRLCSTLAKSPGVLRWLAIKDRDLRSDEEMEADQREIANLLIWPRRAIENLFLDAGWIRATLARVTGSSEWREDAIHDRMMELAAPQKPDVVRILVERELEREYPPSVESKKQLDAWYIALRESLGARITEYKRVRAERTMWVDSHWETKWEEWVQGKRLLSELLAISPFRSLAHLEEAMVTTAISNDEFMPEPVKQLRDSLRRL